MRTGGGGIKRHSRRACYVTARPREWAFKSPVVGATAGNLDSTLNLKEKVNNPFIVVRSVMWSSTSGEMQGHYRCRKTRH